MSEDRLHDQAPCPTTVKTVESTVPKGNSLLAPLRGATFRNIWSASLLANFGQLIVGVGAAWQMTQLGAPAVMVALVQSALMLPLVLISLPAGALADILDRRSIALAGLAVAAGGTALLALCASLGLAGPRALLALCFLIGCGVALYGPAWSSSIREQVAIEHLPSAVALNSISYNLARSLGPAIGGAVVAAAGAIATFSTGALLYAPMIVAIARWRHPRASSAGQKERLSRAIISGSQYVLHSSPIRATLLRALVCATAAASVAALSPLIAKHMLGGDARVYGLLLGAFGAGAVGGAMLMGRVRSRLGNEGAATICAVAGGIANITVGVSHALPLSLAGLVLSGAAWTALSTLFNIGVQMSAPPWVGARALAWFRVAMTAGITLGAWFWGLVATTEGTGTAMIASGTLLLASPLIGLLLPMPQVAAAEENGGERQFAPEVELEMSPRSGPIVIEIDYRIEAVRTVEFADVMRQLRGVRLRSGAFRWSLSRDLAAPHVWTERYVCPTWEDYLRQRTRSTASDRLIEHRAGTFDSGDPGRRVRRRLEH